MKKSFRFLLYAASLLSVMAFFLVSRQPPHNRSDNIPHSVSDYAAERESIRSAPQNPQPAELNMTPVEVHNGDLVFQATANDFIESFNYIYRERNHETYLRRLEEWMLSRDRTPFYGHDAQQYYFTADAKRWTMPSLTIFTPEDRENIYELVLTFDDHGYQETMYQHFEEICFCALSVILPELDDDALTTLYEELYRQTSSNFYPDSDNEALRVDVIYCRKGIGLFGYYGAGTANICIVPLSSEASLQLSEYGAEFYRIE